MNAEQRQTAGAVTTSQLSVELCGWDCHVFSNCYHWGWPMGPCWPLAVTSEVDVTWFNRFRMQLIMW